MSDITIATPAPAPAPAPAPTPEAGVAVDNAAFARLRTQADANKAEAVAEKARANELATKLADIERAGMTEIDRLKAENAELKPIQAEHGKFASTLERLYAAELAEVAEDKREAVAGLSGAGDWASRLEALRNAKTLIVAAPAPAGTVVQPGRTGVPEVPQTRPDPRKLAWGDVIPAVKKL